MLDVLAPWITNGGAVGLLAAVAWMVFTGRLVPRRVHDQAVASERARGDDWRDAYRAEVARGETRDRQLGEILTFVRAPREAA
jgi:hypothetical protein